MIETKDIELERRLVSTMLQSTEVLSDMFLAWEAKTGKNWFTTTELKWIAVETMRHFKRLGVPPSKQVLISILKDDTARAGMSQEERDNYHESYDMLLDRLLAVEVMDKTTASSIVMRLLVLYRNRMVGSVGEQYATMIEQGEIEEGLNNLRGLIKQIDEIEEDSVITISDLFDLDVEIESVIYRRENPDSDMGILTGIREFDEETHGVHFGETGLIVAPLGRGKTTLAVELGATAIEQGYNVLQFTIESPADMIKRKYFSRISGIPYNFFKHAEKAEAGEFGMDWLERFRMKMENLKERCEARLKIVDIPEGCTPSMIENIATNGLGSFRPDMIIVDHQGLLDPDKGTMGKDGRLGWQTQGEITKSLMAKGRKIRNSTGSRGIAMWVLVQSHIGAQRKKTEDVSNADIGLSYLIGQPAHYIIHIIRDEVMAANNEAVFKITKVRDGKDNLIAYVKTDFKTSTFIKRSADTVQPITNQPVVF